MTGTRTIKNAPSTIQAILIFSAMAMVGLSIYLTNHYFIANFARDLDAGGMLCNISAYFNCNTVSMSTISNIFGVPIALFGMIVGSFVFIPYLFGEERTEGVNFYMLAANALGCLFLMFYSIVILKTLCPMCTLYYIASWAAFFCYYKYSDNRSFDLLTAGLYGLVFLIAFGATYGTVKDRHHQHDEVARQMIEQFDRMPVLGNPDIESPYWIARATDNFEDAPIQMVVFSDYQCPACKAWADITHQIADAYEGYINIQYHFYPLDEECNPFMSRSMHRMSCYGAYLSVCLSQDFVQVHDDIFEAQQDLSMDWMREYAQRRGVLECMEAEETRLAVRSLVQAAEKFDVRSTPTSLINGVKVEGVFPFQTLKPIFDELIRRAN